MASDRRRPRLFVAVRPPVEVRAALERLPRAAEPGVRWVPPHQWHVTLRFLGDADADDVLRALAESAGTGAFLRGWAVSAASTRGDGGAGGGAARGGAVGGAAARGGAVTAVLGPVVSRLGRDVVVLPVRGLDTLASVVVEATAHLGAPPDPRGFAGHLTLARLRHRAACGVAGARFSAQWDVHDIELVSSELGPDGARHTVLATIGLER